MVAVLAGLIGFAVAFALWRWVLRNDNWLEGGIAALVFGIFCGVVGDSIQRVRERAAEIRASRAQQPPP